MACFIPKGHVAQEEAVGSESLSQAMLRAATDPVVQHVLCWFCPGLLPLVVGNAAFALLAISEALVLLLEIPFLPTIHKFLNYF